MKPEYEVKFLCLLFFMILFGGIGSLLLGLYFTISELSIVYAIVGIISLCITLILIIALSINNYRELQSDEIICSNNI